MPHKKLPHTNKDAWPKRELFLFEPRTLLIIIISSVLTLAVAFFGEKGVKFMTSVISPIPEHAPFDGTVSPVAQVPNWVALSEAERKAAFSELPQEKLIPLPPYNPSRLAIPVIALKWNDPKDDQIRNEKITYSVPYLGSYRLDGLEGSGSHPAVDIKLPQGTPIRSIANGTVVKVDNGNGGFGKHIVVQHNNAPSLDDPSQKTTFFSSYSHLSQTGVNVNDVVTKGQVIGFSGITGTATTPHLHFQIDSSDAPWHPYWPFSSGDLKAAGVSFFDGINTGLKQNNAIAFTVSPMKFVQNFAGSNAVVVAANPAAVVSQVDPFDGVTFTVQLPMQEGRFELGDEIAIMIQAFDKDGKLLDFPKFEDSVSVSTLNGNVRLNRDSLTAATLRTGISKLVTATGTALGREKILVRFRNREFSSPEFELIAPAPRVAGFEVALVKNAAVIGEMIPVIVRALDSAGARVTEGLAFEEIPEVSLEFQIGSLNVNGLAVSNFGAGESLVTFTPTAQGVTNVFVRYKGQTYRSPIITVTDPLAALAASVITAPPLPESPAPPAAVVSAEPENEHGVEPTPPGSPLEDATSTVAVEIPPAPLEAASSTPQVAGEQLAVTPPIEAPTSTPSILPPFSDVPVGHTFFTALSELKAAGLVAGYSDGTFQPDKEVSRAEAVTLVLRAINEQVHQTPKELFPDVSVQSWYARFVTSAYELGFIKGNPDGTFRPNQTVNLAEFLTMLFVAAKTDVDPAISTPLPEGVTASDWFAPYIQIAIQKGIIDVVNNALDVSKALTRGEVAEMLFRVVREGA